MTRLIARLTAGLALSLATTIGHAERPMIVDDAGTLDRGGFKLEAGWSKDDRERGWELVGGYAPLENFELEIAFGRARDRATRPALRLEGTGVAAKWVPLQQEAGLSAGIKLEYARSRIDERADGKHTGHERALTGLASWGFDSGQIAHLNLGREWARHRGAREAVNVWGLGFEQPLVDGVELTLEWFGARHSRPDRQLGVRWEVAEGLKLSAALGRGNGRSFGNAGIAWEF